MKLAERLSRLGEAHEPMTIREAVEEIPRALVAGVEEALLRGETHYTVRLGLPELRRLLGRKVARMGGPSYDSSLDQILVTTGESEALFVALLGISAPPGEVLVASPEPRRHDALFRLMGLELRAPAESGERTRLVYREASAEDENHAGLLRHAKEHDVPDLLNLKGSLGRIAGERAPAFPPFSEDRTVILGHLDSLPGMPSFRVGFLLGPERWLQRIRVWKQALTICSPAPSQRAAWIALGGSEEPAP